jgi:hypothetical protein
MDRALFDPILGSQRNPVCFTKCSLMSEFVFLVLLSHIMGDESAVHWTELYDRHCEPMKFLLQTVVRIIMCGGGWKLNNFAVPTFV